MAPKVPDNFVATLDAAARQLDLPARVDAAASGVPVTREAVLRELLDDSHARLRELTQSLEDLKDFLAN